MDWKKLALEQAALIKQLQARIAALEAEVATLKKNSSHSSTPPSGGFFCAQVLILGSLEVYYKSGIASHLLANSRNASMFSYSFIDQSLLVRIPRD